MRSGLIASLSIAVAAVAGLVIGDDALPVALADKANGAITSDATRPTLAGNPVRDYLSSAERSRGLRNGLLPAGTRSLLNTPGRMRHGDYRSEEHTSELQSLMRISYAVFCLKQKNNRTEHKAAAA